MKFELAVLVLGSSVNGVASTFWWPHPSPPPPSPPAPTPPAPTPYQGPKAVCKDIVVCKGDVLKEDDFDGGCSDPDGYIKSKWLDNYGPCDKLGIFDILLSIADDHGLQDKCTAKYEVRDCSPVPAPVPPPVAPPVKAPVPPPPVPAPVPAPVAPPNKKPVAKCKDAIVCKGDKITASDIDNGSSDSDGSIVSKKLDFKGPFVGTTSVVLTVKDNLGGKAKCGATVYVKSCGPVPAPATGPVPAPVPLNKPPKAKCKDASVCLGGTITVSDIDSGSKDKDGYIVNKKLNKSGPFTKLGTVRIKLTVIDNEGAMDKCKATVVVRDCSPPTAPVPKPVNPPPQPAPQPAPVLPPAPVTAPQPAPVTSPTRPSCKCKDVKVCVGEEVKADDVYNGSYSGGILHKSLFNFGPFDKIGSEKCTLKVWDDFGYSDECTSTVDVVDCPAPTPAPTSKHCWLWILC